MKSGRQKQRRGPHKVVRALVNEMTVIDGELCLADERFEFWAKHFWVRYPRCAHKIMYAHIGQLSYRLLERQCLAALQCFALATLGLSAAQSSHRSAHDAFLSSVRARATRRSAQAMAASAMPVAPPPSAGIARTAPPRPLPLSSSQPRLHARLQPRLQPSPHPKAHPRTQSRARTIARPVSSGVRVTSGSSYWRAPCR